MSNVTNTTGLVYDRRTDAEGAMKFTVSVVMVYGGAVFGVLLLGFLRGLSRNHDEEDKQVDSFLRDIGKTRTRCTRDRELNAVYKKLENLGLQWNSGNDRNTGSALGRGIANVMALPVVMSRGRCSDEVRKSRRSSWNRIKNISRAFSRRKTSKSYPGLNVESRIDDRTGNEALMDLRENAEEKMTNLKSEEEKTINIQVDVNTISEITEESDCGSFQSTSSYLHGVV